MGAFIHLRWGPKTEVVLLPETVFISKSWKALFAFTCMSVHIQILRNIESTWSPLLSQRRLELIAVSLLFEFVLGCWGLWQLRQEEQISQLRVAAAHSL